MASAEDVQRRLDASGAQVVLLARAGQDLQKYGLRYSHLGFAYRETLPSAVTAPATSASAARDAAPRAVWRVAHKLNQCGTAVAAVYQSRTGRFLPRHAVPLRCGLRRAVARAQAALLPVLRDNQRLVQWHTPAYSVVAYPWATTYQQSNQWALETLAGAMDPHAGTRQTAQAWLQLHDYQPTVLHLGPFTRLGGRMTQANVAFDDHPNSKRFSDHIDAVTVDSMFARLPRVDPGGIPLTVR